MTSLAPTSSSRTLLLSFLIFLRSYSTICWFPEGDGKVVVVSNSHFTILYVIIFLTQYCKPQATCSLKGEGGHESPFLSCPKSRSKSTGMGISEYKLFPKLVHKDEDKVDSISPHNSSKVGGWFSPRIIQPGSSRNTLYSPLSREIFPGISLAVWPIDCVTLAARSDHYEVTSPVLTPAEWI